MKSYTMNPMDEIGPYSFLERLKEYAGNARDYGYGIALGGGPYKATKSGAYSSESGVSYDSSTE